MANDLTQCQRKVFDALKAFIAENGFPPTNVELAKIMGMASGNAIFQHLRYIEKKGWIELVPRISRGIRLLRD
jgi:repressor LexA